MKIILLVSCLFTLGCAEIQLGSEPTPQEVAEISKKMISSLKAHKLSKSDPAKIILVLNITNKTAVHFDTEMITDTIITELLRDGSFGTIAERTKTGEILKDWYFAQEMKKQKGTSTDGGTMMESEEELEPGITPPDLVMYGSFTGIERHQSNVTDVYYKITIRLVDSRTQVVKWQEQKDIHRREGGGWFGS